MKTISQEQVLKALDSLEAQLEGEESVVKASDGDLDQPEGADLGNPAKDKMSDSAKAKKAKKAFPPAKSEDSDEDDEEKSLDADADDEGGDSDPGEEKKKAYKKAKKSFQEEMPEEIQTKIDVSEFLKSLVNHTGATIDALREYVAKSDVASGARYDDLATAVEDIQKSQAKIGIVLE